MKYNLQLQFSSKAENSEKQMVLSKLNQICLPAPLKLTSEHVLSCLFSLYKNQKVKVTICQLYVGLFIDWEQSLSVKQQNG